MSHTFALVSSFVCVYTHTYTFTFTTHTHTHTHTYRHITGEGLPLPHDPSQKGDLFIKIHVHFPESLPLPVEQLASLRSLLSRAPVALPASPHQNASQRATKGTATAMCMRANETEFGENDPDDSPMLCAQQ